MVIYDIRSISDITRPYVIYNLIFLPSIPIVNVAEDDAAPTFILHINLIRHGAVIYELCSIPPNTRSNAQHSALIPLAHKAQRAACWAHPFGTAATATSLVLCPGHRSSSSSDSSTL